MVRVSGRFDHGDIRPLYVDEAVTEVGDDTDWDETVVEVTHALDTHTDVDTGDPDDGDVLTWDEAAGEWVASPGGSMTPDEVRDAGRWELAVITGSPPDPLYADGDFLYLWVPGP